MTRCPLCQGTRIDPTTGAECGCAPPQASAGPAWTAGPWFAEGNRSYKTVRGADGEYVANTDHGLPEREANARLISAAPDLYEALEGLTRATYADTLADKPTKRMSDALNAAAAALAKATGHD